MQEEEETFPISSNKTENKLKCHYCGYEEKVGSCDRKGYS